MDVARDGIRVGQGMKRGMHGKVLAGFGARLQLTLTTSTLTASVRRRACLTSICMWAAGGRWELAAATGRGEAQAGATGSVGTAGGLVVHGGAGGAATVRDQAHGAAASDRPELWHPATALASGSALTTLTSQDATSSDHFVFYFSTCN